MNGRPILLINFLSILAIHNSPVSFEPNSSILHLSRKYNDLKRIVAFGAMADSTRP